VSFTNYFTFVTSEVEHWTEQHLGLDFIHGEFIGRWLVESDRNVRWQSVVEMMKSSPQESDHIYFSFLPTENWDGTENDECDFNKCNVTGSTSLFSVSNMIFVKLWSVVLVPHIAAALHR